MQITENAILHQILDYTWECRPSSGRGVFWVYTWVSYVLVFILIFIFIFTACLLKGYQYLSTRHFQDTHKKLSRNPWKTLNTLSQHFQYIFNALPIHFHQNYKVSITSSIYFQNHLQYTLNIPWTHSIYHQYPQETPDETPDKIPIHFSIHS